MRISTTVLLAMTVIYMNDTINGECFTMPPKHNEISEWSFFLPNVNSPDYKHNTHECPPAYGIFKQYSNIEKYCSGFSSNCYPKSKVVSYVVCCKCNSVVDC